MTDETRAFLMILAHMETSMPTLAAVRSACEAHEVDAAESARLLGEAMALGLVDAAEDCGPRTQFAISTLGAEKLGIRLTSDSRRWLDRKGRLLGPHDPSGRYLDRRPDVSEDESVPLHARVDPRQHRPDEILAAAERTPAKPYSGDVPELAPYIRRFYGLGVIWAGEERISGPCPHCGGARMGIDAYCLKCHRAGADRFLEKPKASRRRQMPRHTTTLKGGV